MIRVLSLFSGIGGMDLGLAWTGGFETVAFFEIEPFQQAILAKHWPDVRCYPDVRELSADRLRADGIVVDAICGGFPCQPHSIAGKREASEDERDLWPHFARLIREIRPRWVVAENVPGLRSSESGWFFGTLLRDLAAAGYDAEWSSISASDIGAFHERERVWIVAYPHAAVASGPRLSFRQRPDGEWSHSAIARGGRRTTESGLGGAPSWLSEGVDPGERLNGDAQGPHEAGRPVEGLSMVCGTDVEEAVQRQAGRPYGLYETCFLRPALCRAGADEVDPEEDNPSLAGPQVEGDYLRGVRNDEPTARPPYRPKPSEQQSNEHPDALQDVPRFLALGGETDRTRGRRADASAVARSPWAPGWEAGTPRVVSRPQEKTDRRKRLIGLGNAVVPQIVEIIGRAILEAEDAA